MKKNYHLMAVLAAGLTCLIVLGCENSNDLDQLSTPSASLLIEKVETAYYDGAEKIEMTNSGTKVETQNTMDELDKAIYEMEENYIKFTTRYGASKDISGAGFDVGVIPSSQGCPLSSELVQINLDNEDKNTKTSENGSWNSSWQVTSGGNTMMYFCKIDGRLLSNVGGNFAVLKLGINKPNYVVNVTNLTLDCEDKDGRTAFVTKVGDAGPNSVDNNRNLLTSWYVFNNPGGNGIFPNVGFSYGVLGNPKNVIATSDYYTDDEDNGNKNVIVSIEKRGPGDPYVKKDYRVKVAGIQVGAMGIEFSMADSANPGGLAGNWGTWAPAGTIFHLAKVK